MPSFGRRPRFNKPDRQATEWERFLPKPALIRPLEEKHGELTKIGHTICDDIRTLLTRQQKLAEGLVSYGHLALTQQVHDDKEEAQKRTNALEALVYTGQEQTVENGNQLRILGELHNFLENLMIYDRQVWERRGTSAEGRVVATFEVECDAGEEERILQALLRSDQSCRLASSRPQRSSKRWPVTMLDISDKPKNAVDRGHDSGTDSADDYEKEDDNDDVDEVDGGCASKPKTDPPKGGEGTKETAIPAKEVTRVDGDSSTGSLKPEEHQKVYRIGGSTIAIANPEEAPGMKRINSEGNTTVLERCDLVAAGVLGDTERLYRRKPSSFALNSMALGKDGFTF